MNILQCQKENIRNINVTDEKERMKKNKQTKRFLKIWFENGILSIQMLFL